MFVNDDAGLNLLALEPRFDKVDLRLHRRQVVLSATLKHEVIPQPGYVRNLRYIQPDILGQDRSKACHYFFRLPTLPLKINDIGLHEHCAAITESRHRVGPKSDISVILDLHPEAFGS